MVKFSVEQVRSIMDQPNNIRNMTVIAHVDHGKSTLSDALICKAGIISEKVAGQARALDGRKDQIERGITIKSTGVSMYYKTDINKTGKPENEKEYLINLIDSPGHVDFSSEVTAALRVTDGALVVVDTVQGVCVQTQTVLRQAMQERIKPILMINKVDRAIGELKLSGQEIYQQFQRAIDNVNVVISNYQCEDMGEIQLSPEFGNVIFGAGKDQWAFSLNTFARVFSKKYGFNEEVMMKKLWGDNYFNKNTKSWQTEAFDNDGKPIKRAFVEYIMDPIIQMTQQIFENKKEQYLARSEKLNIELTNQEKSLEGKQMVKKILSKWLPAADCLLEAMILHLPSPVVAQKYRTPYLYEGPKDEVFDGMSACDPKGPLSVYISKMIPIEGNRFAAFGRIFSGTARTGEKIRIMGANYKPGGTVDLFEKNISQIGVFMMGKNPEYILDVPCGNTVAIIGIDDCVLKTGTLGSLEVKENYPIRCMKYSVSPVFRVAVKPKNAAELPKLQKGLTKLSKSDPLLKVDIEETGQIVLSGSGQLHIQICINDLKAYSQCEIIVSKPTVTYKQTITSEVNLESVLLTKSANGHNRLFGTSDILNNQLVDAIENGNIVKEDAKIRAKKLTEEFKWDKNDSMKIWTFGPEDDGANVLVEQCKGIQGLNEIRNSVCTGFQTVTKTGVLAEESLRGARFNIIDAKIHADSVHRGDAQMIPCSRRLFQGLELASTPSLLEPIFMCEITTPSQSLGGVYSTLSKRRGQIVEDVLIEGSPLHIIRAYLPVAESFGFTSLLRENTQGMAFPQNFFDHWQLINGIPYEDKEADALVLQIRKRKGLKEQMPLIQNYIDKL